MPLSREASVTSSLGGSGLRTSLRLGSGTQVCADAELKGEISMGSKCFVHPKARIIALDGPIVIGDGNLIEEQTLIINEADPSEKASGERTVMQIGNNNFFEIGSTVKSKKVGDNNVFECKSFVGRHVEVTQGCTVGSLCSVTCRDRLAENSIIYGQERLRRIAAEKPQNPAAVIEYLSHVAPKFHNMKKTSKSSSSAASSANQQPAPTAAKAQ